MGLFGVAIAMILSHLAWVRGLKSTFNKNPFLSSLVAPCVGAWIEIQIHYYYTLNILSSHLA